MSIEGQLNRQACDKPAVFQKNTFLLNASWYGALLFTALVSGCGGGDGGREERAGGEGEELHRCCGVSVAVVKKGCWVGWRCVG